jgi:E3 ubiquitin-protein ligase TRIP12
MSRFLASILASRDQSTLVVSALQLVELLLSKLPVTYQYVFRKEGVMHEVERLAEAPLVSPRTKKSISGRAVDEVQRKEQQAAQEPDAGGAADLGTSIHGTASAPSGITRALQQHKSGVVIQSTPAVDGGRQSSTGKTELTPAEAIARDSITLRARHVRTALASASTESIQRADADLEAITELAKTLSQVLEDVAASASEAEAKAALLLKQVADLFSSEQNAASSFEMLESGLVDTILRFATGGGNCPC